MSKVSALIQSLKSDIVGNIGCVSGIIGAVLVASNSALSAYGYIFFLISSATLVAWALRHTHSSQLVMQAVFTAINLWGAYNWLVAS